jgi:hypothetical protein
MRAVRIWGAALAVLGIVFLIEALAGITEAFVSDLILIGSILIGQMLPLPQVVEVRLQRWSLPVKIAIIVLVLAIAAVIMVALNRLTGLDLDYAPALVFLVIGFALLAVSQIQWRKAPVE